MGYVKTLEEVAQIQQRFRTARFKTESMEVYFHTDPDFVREVLPPCFIPAQDPRGYVQIGRSQAFNLEVEFAVASIHLAANHQGTDGWYHLTMLLTGDMPVTIGRELWGEAKKRGTIDFDPTLPRISGRGERHGVAVIEASMEATVDLGPQEETLPVLDLKTFLNGSATRLEHDPIVLQSEYVIEYQTYYEGPGSITLRSTAEDPCGTVPILSVDRAVYSTHTMRPVFGAQHRVSGALESYVPYVLGRSYDIMARRTALR